MSFPLIGNQRLCSNLTAMLRAGRLPHAIILEGGEGLGKKTLARYIAKAALCGEENPPCLSCKSCHLVEVGSHPDCLTVSPDGGSIKVDQIRALRGEAYLSPMMSAGRAFIIDRTHTMNPNAQNALLKVLEEPPAGVTFILLAKSAELLLPTIRSRCVCFTLAPVEIGEAGFRRVEELTGAAPEEAQRLLIAADGNIGRAVAMRDGNGDSLSAVASALLTCAAQNDRFGLLRQLQPFIKSREQVRELLPELKSAVGREMKKKAVKEYSSFTYRRLDSAYTQLCEIEKTLDFNPSLSLVFCRITSALCGESEIPERQIGR